MPELSNFSANDLAALTAEGAEAFKTSMVKAGFDSSAVEAATSQRGTKPNPGFVGNPDLALSPAQREAAAANLSRFWTGPESALEGLKGSTQAATDGPDSYRLNYGDYAKLAGENLASLDREFKEGFAAAGVPQSHAQPLVDAILNTLDKFPPDLAPEAAELRRSHEMSAFNRLPNSDELLRFAQLAYRALPDSLRDMLDEHGALGSAQAYISLANIGRQLEYNSNKTKG